MDDVATLQTACVALADKVLTLEDRYAELLRLILDEMPRATAQDLACDGPVGNQEGEIWRRIEAEAKGLRESS